MKHNLRDQVEVLDELYLRPMGKGRVEGRYTCDGEKYNVRLVKDGRIRLDLSEERLRSVQ